MVYTVNDKVYAVHLTVTEKDGNGGFGIRHGHRPAPKGFHRGALGADSGISKSEVLGLGALGLGELWSTSPGGFRERVGHQD
jgi:hypothetical protein